MRILAKITGIVLLLAGLVFTYTPNLWSKAPLSNDAYQRIESRVVWGFLIGLGLFFIVHDAWSAWKLILCALFFLLNLGVIIARIFGLSFDGYFSKQILWLAIEIAVLIIFGILYRYAKH